MKSIKLILFSCSLLIVFNSNAQFGQFWNTRTQKNPAFQVLNHSHFANVTHRNNYPSLSGSSKSNTVSYGAFVQKLSGGVGFYFNNNSWTPAYKSNAIKVAYNYQRQLSRHARISFGTGAGAIFTKYTKTMYSPNFIFDPTDGTSFGLDFGTAFSWKKLVVGAGIQNILKSNDVARILNGEKWVNFTAQYSFGKETGLQFIPEAMLESDFDRHRAAVNGKVGYKNKYFLGVGILLDDRMMYTAELFLFQKVRLSYTYLYSFERLYSPQGGSHELGINLEIKRKPRPRRTSGGVSF